MEVVTAFEKAKSSVNLNVILPVCFFLGSWFRASFSTYEYVYKYPTRYNNGISFYYKITLHVSGTLRPHHQEYNNCS
jgi:hypothetical protein